MKLTEYHPSFASMVENYYIADTTYTGRPAEAVIISRDQPDYHSILCIEQEQLVTFFVLDGGADKYKYTNNPNSFLLRSFSTDTRQTRKGYGKMTLTELPYFVKHHYPHINEIVLGVNEKNTPAIRLYENNGFHDTLQVFKGRLGNQKILSMNV
jgi:ribosomal protein S18 acetylase RimI-like enzyme